ncbi:hypothetical protein LTR94_013951 [Friedmanniomyces endolithicus]|nr:hypothetical protein LTR94_013951 [Friedmanniomyces endolithicus]
MAQRPFKVFRTSAGFEDAYVAAKSQKAALEAWGARSNLFASGMAEIVTDPQLTKGACTARQGHPGASRHASAAPRGCGRRSAASRQVGAKRTARERWGTQLGASEAQTKAQSEQARQCYACFGKAKATRETLRSKRDLALAKLEERRDREDKAYRSALDRWRGQAEP